MINAFAGRWLIAGAEAAEPRAVTRALGFLAGLLALFVATLAINHAIERRWPDLWMALIVALALAMARNRYEARDAFAVRLWQLLGALSAFYALVHYPLMPALQEAAAERLYSVLLGVWVLALACGVACFRRPSLALVPPAFLFWSSVAAARVTGLVHGHTLDVDPLPEVSICLGVGLAIASGARRLLRHADADGAADGRSIDPVAEFARIVPVLAICIHLANYFWSAVAKITLHGPFLSWVRLNNPLYIYLAALDDRNITFSPYGFVTSTVAAAIDRTHILSNIVVFAAQSIAILGFLMPKRGLIILLLVFDLMHIAIAVSAGANFWPWVLLNVAVAVAVSRGDYRRPKPLIGVAAAAFICLSPLVANVAKLGWYDSGANNNAFLEAEDVHGQRYYISPNFFTFYSYPFAHMSYGMPEPRTAFAVGDPNGGTRRYDIAKAGLACDVAKLIQPGSKTDVDSPAFRRFIVDYAVMARGIENKLGIFPYNLYPHHFYVRPGLMAPFDALDKDRVVAYIYRRESVCLSLKDGRLQRRLVSTGELRIDVPHGR